jgi:hypothetical protein
MNTRTPIALAAALLLSGATVAGAATMSQTAPNDSMAKASPSDTLSLSSTQQKTAWKDLYMASLNQKVPSGFTVKVGAVVPKDVTTAPVNTRAADAVPALKPYRFAMVQKKLIIVNPSDHRIAEVITG